MRRIAVALFLSACGGARVVPEVSLAPQEPASAPTHATLLDCAIVGTGERPREGDDADAFPFRVFDDEEAREPLFVIARPDLARVTWSHFPARAERGRARVAIGGQMHVRHQGFADLWGRTFTTTARMDSVAGHLWAYPGAAAYVMSASRGEIFLSVATPFRAPRAIVVQGNCADVVYEPRAPQREPKWRKITAMSDASSFRLFASPSSRAFTTITRDEPVLFEVLERAGDFVHVAGEEGDVGFDAWVLASDTREISGAGRVRPPRDARPPIVRVTGPNERRVTRDTPLFLGDPWRAPHAIRDAWVERGAAVVIDAAHGATIDGREMVPFEFADGFIVAPEGGRLWIAKDVVSSVP